MGERFLKIIFDNAIKMDVDEIYITLFENKREEVKLLKCFLEKWGFVSKAKNIKTGELVLIKDMRNYDYSKPPIFNFPLLKEDKKITIMPIRAEYHTKLFPDLHLSNEKCNIHDEKACSYSIEKIYVCGKKIYNLPGDLVIIYFMAECFKTYRSVITGLGIIQEVLQIESEDKLVEICKNKSVFEEEELRKFYKEKRYRNVVKMLFLYKFKNKINLKKLQDLNILNDEKTPQFNTSISDEDFEKIMELEKGKTQND